MALDLTKTAVIFLALIAVGIGGLAVSGVMAVGTIMMMVLPSTVVFGLVCLALGVQYGEYRATN
jgi:predicted RND superfamily exporter protein